MFKYISNILEQFSASQKIVALSILLISIITISIAPSFISAITLDREELNFEIKRKNIRINYLKKYIDSLEINIRKNQMECTNQIITREEEFIGMLEKLSVNLRSQNNKTQEKMVSINSVTSFNLERQVHNFEDSLISMIQISELPREEKIITYKKDEINSTLLMINEMKKKIKKK
jgi:hypothetical protein